MSIATWFMPPSGITMLATGVAATLALLVVLVTGVVVLAQGSDLARSLQPGTATNRRRLRATSAIAAAVAVAALLVGFADLAGDERWSAGRVVVYNAVFFAAALTAVILFAVAPRRPRTV